MKHVKTGIKAMARGTKKELRGKIIYSVFTRNYSREGTFEAVRKDLDRIQALGTDIIWLMPVQPSGKVHRKGSLGSPYAIRDYRAVDPAQGTPEDFRRLTEDIHKRGMKCIIDVVYHHTSPDSRLAAEHPEWFYHKEDGSFGNQVGDWWDVIDLDFNRRELWDELIDTLKMWAEFVDGFRCDVASMVPVEFWEKAREEVAKVRPDAIWLAESVEGSFVVFNRSRGVYCASDSEIYRAFDIAYEYDLTDEREAFLESKAPLQQYLNRLNLQEEIFPDNYDKLRFLENHDRKRIHALIPKQKQLINWTSFLYFQKGTVLLYNGQENECTKTPSLFDADPIDWLVNSGSGTQKENPERTDLTPLLQKLAEIRHKVIPTDTTFHAEALSGDVCCAVQRENAVKDPRTLLGIFALGVPGKAAGDVMLAETAFPYPLPDGSYKNLISGERIDISGRKIPISAIPLIIEIS